VSWLQLRLVVPAPRVEAAEEALFALGAVSVTLLDAGDTPIHEPDPGQTPLWPVSMVQALFESGSERAGLLQSLESAGLIDSPDAVDFSTLADQDWERVWMDRFQPMRFGRDLWICPSHMTPEPDWPVVIRLDPGLAFGTGTHPTTALCLEWVDGQEFPGSVVIDYGCGSGVLAIAAALKGAARVIAIDHDPQALEATGANARANGVDDRLEILAPEDTPQVQADVLLANILAAPLVTLAPRLTDLVCPGGWLVMSGMLAEQESTVAACYETAFEDFEHYRREDWAAVACRRRA